MLPKFKGIIVEKETVENKLNEFILFKKSQGLEEISIKGYNTLLHNLLPLNQQFDSVKWEEVVIKIQDMSIAPYSKVSYLKALRCFINWCGIDYHIRIPNVEVIKPTYTDEEIKKLLTKPKKCTFIQLRTYTMLCLAFDTGLRLNSMRNIKTQDIQENTVVVSKTKTHKVQILPFSHTTKLALNAFMKHRLGNPEDYLFCDIYGNKMSESAPKKALTVYCNKVGVKCKGWHCCRHTFAKKFLIDCKQSPFMLQKMLGHSTLEQSKHYCNIYSQDLIESYKSPVESIHRHKIKG